MGIARSAQRFGLRLAIGSRRREEAKQGAFEAMVARDWERFWRYAVRLCAGNTHDAEDLLSETMLDAFKAFDAFRGEGFDRWFFRMMTTNRIDMARRAKVRRAESLEAAFLNDAGEAHGRQIAGDAAETPERLLLDPLFVEPLEQALAALPEEFRAAVLLCDVEGMDYQEIAQTLKIPIGTVRSRIFRGRQRLRECLERQGWHR